MARRNLFQPPPPPAPDATVSVTPRFPNTGAMSGMKTTLRDMSSNAVREIDPSLIEDDGPRDRLDFGADAVNDLVESIRQHGQQVPVMVRPLREKPGHYQIVYGRRRLAALRILGQPARAMVRLLDDTQAILAQGQENSVRLDPSFIEKALFVNELSEAGHGHDVILEALAIDRPMLSRMQKVARSLPVTLIQAIGPAHGVGRRRWEEMADAARATSLDPATLPELLHNELEALGSDERFARVMTELSRLPAPTRSSSAQPETRQISTADGRPLAEMKANSRSLTLKFDARAHPDFAAWLQSTADDRLQDLYATWAATRG